MSASRRDAAWCTALASACLACAVQLGCDRAPSGSPTTAAAPAAPPALDEDVLGRIARNPPLGALPPDPTNRFADSLDAAALGHRIFFDPSFSAGGTVSCATCHDPAKGFADGRTLAQGEALGTRHSMTALNSAYNRWFTWDGRADTAWSQAIQPFEAPHEHGITRERIVEIVAQRDDLRALYFKAFGAPPKGGTDVDATTANIGKAIAAYERKLVTGPSAYDRWWTKHRANDPTADAELSPDARRGLELFFGKANCWECHHGANFTDGEFHNVGVPTPDGGVPTDPGRYAVVDGVREHEFNAAGPHSDDRESKQARISASLVRSPDLWGQFKTPSLRVAAESAPYMHQGQFATLEDVVRFYSTLEGAVALDHHQELVLVKLDLTAQEQADLVAFLRALQGTAPAAPWGVAPASASAPAPAAAPAPVQPQQPATVGGAP